MVKCTEIPDCSLGIGDSGKSQCEEKLSGTLVKNGVKGKREADVLSERVLEGYPGKITKIAQAELDGTSHYYLMVEGSERDLRCIGCGLYRCCPL